MPPWILVSYVYIGGAFACASAILYLDDRNPYRLPEHEETRSQTAVVGGLFWPVLVTLALAVVLVLAVIALVILAVDTLAALLRW